MSSYIPIFKFYGMKYPSIILYIVFSFFVSNIFAQDGQLDTSFGDNGFVVTDISGQSAVDIGEAVTQQNDGKIVMVGRSEVGSNVYDAVVVRYMPDGSLDTSFGVNGIVFTDLGSNFDTYASVEIQNEEKILVSAKYFLGEGDFVLVQYLPDGSLDTSFGNGGMVFTDLGEDDTFGEMTLQPDNKIVVVGTSEISGIGKLTLLRYLPDGNLDPIFGNNGILITNVSSSADGVTTIKVLDNGKILVGARINSTFQLHKFEWDGSIDTSFGNLGVVVIGIASTSETNTFDLTTEGKIVVAIRRQISSQEWEGVLIRYLPDGALDISFGTDGIAVMSNENFRPRKILIQPNQKMLILGNAPFLPDSNDCIVTRYKMNGSLDTTFGPGGAATQSEYFGGNFMLQEDGKIVWVGAELFITDIVLVRYLNDPFTNGLDDQLLNNLKVYPNPSLGNFTIEYDFIVGADIPYHIVDVSGKVLQKGFLSENQTRVDLSVAESGMYLLTTSAQTIRLIKE